VPDEADALTDPGRAHALGVYDTDAFLLQTVVEFVRAAPEASTTTIIVLTAAQQELVAAELSRHGVDVTAATSRGDLVQIELEDLRRQLSAGGSIDVGSYRTLAEGLLAATTERGSGLRICGNLHSALWETGEIEMLLEVEGLWNRFAAAPGRQLLCLYASHVFDQPMTRDPFTSLCQQHGVVGPVEDYASLLGADDQQRPTALLEHQEQANRIARKDLNARREQIEAELDRCIRRSEEQRGQFERALASRDVIGQAKGIVMARWHVDEAAAFEMLNDASNRSHRKLHEVASAIIEQQLRAT
jgi:hypothetical protein